MLILRRTEKFLRRQGTPLVNFIFKVGELFIFIIQSLYNCLIPPFYGRNLLRQVIDMGFYSLPVVGLTTIFAGMVIALQSYSGFASVGAESMVANVVLISVTRELAPVLSALMVAGRIGAAMAAEIGTMRVTEQIDALTTLSTNPFKYLVAPRVWSGLIVMPLLVLIGDVIGIFWQPREYAINENFAFTMRRYFDEITNEWIDKALGVVDGKTLNPEGFWLIKKTT